MQDQETLLQQVPHKVMTVEKAQFQIQLFLLDQVEVVQQVQVEMLLCVEALLNQEMVELVQIYHLIFQE